MKNDDVSCQHDGRRDHTGSLPGMRDDSDLAFGATDTQEEASVLGRAHKQFFETEQEALEYRRANGLLARVPEFLEGRRKWALVFPLKCDEVTVRHQTEAEVNASPAPAMKATCWIPCDHVPARSWPLFKARDVLRGLIESLQQEATA